MGDLSKIKPEQLKEISVLKTNIQALEQSQIELKEENEEMRRNIAKLRSLEGKLRDSEKYYRALAEVTKDIIFVINQDDCVEYVNQAGIRLLGCESEKTIIGKPRAQLFPPEIAARQGVNLQRVFQTGEPLNVEAIVVISGHKMHLNTWLVPFKDDAGVVKSVLGVSRDVTERRQAEEALSEEEVSYRALAQNLPCIVYRLMLQKNGHMEFYNDMVQEITGYTADELVQGDVCSIDPIIVPGDRERVVAVVEEAIQRNEPFEVEYRMRSKDGGVHCCVEHGRPINRSDGIPHHIDGVIFDITERKRIEEEIKFVSAQWQTTFNAIKDPVMILDTDFRIAQVNEAAVSFFNMPLPEILGKRCFKLVHRLDEPPDFCPFAKMMKTQKHEEAEAYCDSEDMWFLVSADPITDESGNLVKIVHIIKDITKRKKADIALKHSEERFRGIINNTLSGYFFIDRDGIYRRVNDAWLKAHKYDSADEIIGRHFSVTQVDTDIDKAQKNVEKILTGSPIPTGVFSRLCKDGSIGYHTFSAHPVSVEGQVVGLEGFIIDITESRKMEMALQQSEERFRLLVDNAPDGIFIQTEGRFAYINRAATKMFEASSREQLRGQLILDRLHPDYRAIVRERIRLINEKKVEAALMEQKYLKLNGTSFDVEVTAVPFLYKNKNGALVFFRDITARKQIENAFFAEKRFSETILNSMPGVFYCFDNQLQFKSWNKNFELVSGYSEQEIYKTNPLDFFADKDKHLIEDKVKKVFTEGRASVEADFVSKDGSRKPYFFACYRVEIENKYHLIGVGIDISRRKQAEEALKESEQRFRSMSFTDELTGLYNRRGFITLAEQQLKVAERTKKDMLLFFVDLDKMKQINDTLGHNEGDNALVEVAAILKEAFRESDIVGRIGGDEFAVLAIDTIDETRDVLIQRLYNILGTRNRHQGRKYQISLSIGIAHYDSENPATLDKLMAQADALMYEQKRKKRE